MTTFGKIIRCGDKGSIASFIQLAEEGVFSPQMGRGPEITRRKQKEEPEKNEHENRTAHGTIPGFSMLLCEITYNQSNEVTSFIVRI